MSTPSRAICTALTTTGRLIADMFAPFTDPLVDAAKPRTRTALTKLQTIEHDDTSMADRIDQATRLAIIDMPDDVLNIFLMIHSTGRITRDNLIHLDSKGINVQAIIARMN